MPVLFLWGEDDPNGGATVARSFAPRLPNAELVLVAGAQHAPWLDDLATCVAHTRTFLSECGPLLLRKGRVLEPRSRLRYR